MYAQQTGGAPLWVETQNVQLDPAGRYAVLLGAVNELPMSIFSGDEAHWLGVQVLAAAQPEQARVMLVSVPYALKAQDAETLGGRPASAYLLAEAVAALGSSGKGGKVAGQAAAPEGEGNVFTVDPHTIGAIPKFSAPDTLVDSILKETLVGTEQRIGIGVAGSPTAKLDVNGSVAASGGFLAGSTRFMNPTANVVYKFFEYTPTQASAARFSGTMYSFPNTNDPQDNWVMRLGYNTTAGGGQEDATEPVLNLEWESRYEIVPGVTAQEFHLAHTTAGGLKTRPFTFYADTAGTHQVALNTTQLSLGNSAAVPRAYFGQAGQADWYMGIGASANSLVPVLRVFRGTGISDAYIKFQKGTALDYWRIGSGFYVTQTNGNIGVNVLPNASTSAVIRSTGTVDGVDIVGAAPLFNLRVRNGSGFNAFRVTNSQVDIASGLAFRMYSGNLSGEVATILPTGAATFAGQVHSTSGGFRFPDGTVQTTAASGSSELPDDPADCADGQYARAIDASGDLTCGAIQASEVPSLAGSYVDLTSAQTIGGDKTFTGFIAGATSTFSGEVRADLLSLGNSSWSDGGPPHGVLFMSGALAMHMAGGSTNIFVGGDSGGDFLKYEGPSPGTSNTAVGGDSLRFNTTGYINTALGHWALRANVSGWGNTGVGGFALSSSNSDLNAAVGWGALGSTTTGSFNAAVGASALQNNTIGSNNAALGRYASWFNESGSNNTSIGVESGMSGSTVPYGDFGNRNTTGANNTYLGYRAGPSADAFNNATAIGAHAVVSASNAMVLGDGTVNVGIGTSAPAARLHVANGDVAVTNQSNGVILRATDGSNCFRVTVNNSGVLATAPLTCPD